MAVLTPEQILTKIRSSFEDQYRSREWQVRSAAHREKLPYCNSCGRMDKPRAAHHVNYRPGQHLADAKEGELVTLCEDCHKLITEAIREFRRIASFSNASNIAGIVRALSYLAKRDGDRALLIKIANLL